RAANVLLPRTFPALITVVIEEEDLRAAVLKGWSHAAVRTLDYNKDLPEGFAILTHISTRWYLKDHPPLWQLPRRLFTPMRRETCDFDVSMAENLAAFYAAKDLMRRDELDTTPYRFSPVYEELRREVIDLKSKGLGRDWPIPLEPKFLANYEKQ